MHRIQYRSRTLLLAGLLALVGLGACGEEKPKVGPPNDSLNDDVAFNEIAMRCTHNSYHKQAEFPIHASHWYDHLPLDEQLDAGVRAFELDIHSGKDFPVYHIPLFDKETTCENLAACLTVIAAWSDLSPSHHMLVVWVEVKDELEGIFIKDYSALDGVMRDSLGTRLYTPRDFERGYVGARAALEAEGWPTVGDTRGRVMMVLLDTDAPHYEGYRAYEHSEAGPAMFSNARAEDFDASWAVVTKVNDPRNAEAIQLALDAGLLVASNTGSPDLSDDENQARLDAGLTNGSHMLCDDFPTPRAEGGYWLDIPDFFPSGCNNQTATELCRRPVPSP